MTRDSEDMKDFYVGLSESAKFAFFNLVSFVKEAWLILLLLLGVLMAVWWFADPPPPNTVKIVTGLPGGSQYQLGEEYAEFFKKKGIDLEVVPSTGAIDNLQQLQNKTNGIQAGFIQAGTVDPDSLKQIVSLGAIGYAPIWFFYRGAERDYIDLEAANGHLKNFKGWKISIGEPGGGANFFSTEILKASGVNTDNPEFLKMPVKKSVDALLKGDIDAMFVVDAYKSPNVQKVLSNLYPDIHIGEIESIDGYVKLFRNLQVLTIPEGGIDMVHRSPRRDIKMLATTLHLAVDENLSPSIQYLFLAAAREINGRPGYFANRGEFPVFKNSGLPESTVYQHYEKNGQPWLMTYLPFWLAELVERLMVVVLPLLVLAYPLLISLPGFNLKMKYARINRIYGYLNEMEQVLQQSYSSELRDEYLKRLDFLEHQALKLKVPKRISGDYYSLRTNINYVRECLLRGDQPYRMNDSAKVETSKC